MLTYFHQRFTGVFKHFLLSYPCLHFLYSFGADPGENVPIILPCFVLALRGLKRYLKKSKLLCECSTSLPVHQYPILLCKTFYRFHQQPVVYVVKETFYVKVYHPAIRKTVLPALPQRRKITATCHPVPQFVQQLFLLPFKPFSRHPICSTCSLVTAYFPVRCRYLFHTDGITSIFFLYCWFHLLKFFPLLQGCSK